MSELSEVVRQIRAELNPDGGGYHMAEAADLLAARATQAIDGHVPPLPQQLIRLGARKAIADYRTPTDSRR